MEKRSTPRYRWPRMRKYMWLITYTILLFLLLYRIDDAWSALKWFLNVASPIFVGIVLAFVFHLPMDFYQYKLLRSWEHHPSRTLRKMWRGVSMLLAYLTIFLLIGGLGALIVPRVVDSITALASNFSNYLTKFQVWADGMLSSLSVNPDISEPVSNLWQQGITMLQNVLSSIVSGAVNFTVSMTAVVYKLLLSLMISGFILYNRKKMFLQFRRLSGVVLGAKYTRRIGEILRLANQVFSQFILGQSTEALILGTLCFVGMSLFRMHYALLISTIISVTALIPILGGFIGTIPCAVILLVIDPVQALWFVVFIIVLQQIEGNFIYPHVVGSAVGLPGFWVLSSIIIGGGLFGVWGMLLGTPVAALCYRLTREWVREQENTIGPPES